MSCVKNNDFISLRYYLRIATKGFVYKILLNFRYKGDTLLHMATKNNNPDIVKLLFKYGILTRVLDSSGKSSFEIAEDNDYKDMVEIFKAIDEFLSLNEWTGDDVFFEKIDELKRLGVSLNMRFESEGMGLVPLSAFFNERVDLVKQKDKILELFKKQNDMFFNGKFCLAKNSLIRRYASFYLNKDNDIEKRKVGFAVIEFLLKVEIDVDSCGFIGTSFFSKNEADSLCKAAKIEEKAKIVKFFLLIEKYRQRRKYKKSFVNSLCNERKGGKSVDTRIVVKEF